MDDEMFHQLALAVTDAALFTVLLTVGAVALVRMCVRLVDGKPAFGAGVLVALTFGTLFFDTAEKAPDPHTIDDPALAFLAYFTAKVSGTVSSLGSAVYVLLAIAVSAVLLVRIGRGLYAWRHSAWARFNRENTKAYRRCIAASEDTITDLVKPFLVYKRRQKHWSCTAQPTTMWTLKGLASNTDVDLERIKDMITVGDARVFGDLKRAYLEVTWKRDLL